MRKYLLAFAALVLTFGLTLAGPVQFVKYDETTKELTVKAGKKGGEKTYKLTDKVKFEDADGKEMTFDEAIKKFSGKKAAKRFDLTADEKDDTKIEKIKFTAGKKKKDKN